jgi:hypothetical protein
MSTYFSVLQYCELVLTNYSWINTLLVSLDGCFKHKLKARAFVDPDLSRARAYFMDDTKYDQFSRNARDVPEVPFTFSADLSHN